MNKIQTHFEAVLTSEKFFIRLFSKPRYTKNITIIAGSAHDFDIEDLPRWAFQVPRRSVGVTDSDSQSSQGSGLPPQPHPTLGEGP